MRLLLLTAFGLGLVRFAPGTVTSLAVAAGALAAAGRISHVALNIALAAVAAGFSLACVAFGRWGEARFKARDPSAIVADEVVGQCLALLLLPWKSAGEEGAWRWNAAVALTAFIAFRAFDILKPPPIAQSQRLSAGWGILADDVLAGLGALAAAQVIARYLLPLAI